MYINTRGHGGGTIKRRKTCALLLALGMVMLISPLSVGATDQNTMDNSAKIGLGGTLKHEMLGAPKNSKNLLSDKGTLEVNAASKKIKAKKANKYKKTHRKTFKKAKTYRKVKATYKKTKVTTRYKSNGKWKYKTVYKYKKVKASSTYSGSNYRSNSAEWASDSTIDSIMRSGAKYGYRRGISTAAAMQSAGAGDCWAMSEYLHGKFQAAGYNSRIIQYATSYSSRHRSVQLNQNGKWITVPYRAYGYRWEFV